MNSASPLWIAPRTGHNRKNKEILEANRWLTSVVEPHAWRMRMEAVREKFEEGKKAWAKGNRVNLFDDQDLIAWYVFQANAYAAERKSWFEPEAFRISPVFSRLGELLPDLTTIPGVTGCLEELMDGARSQPDDRIFELLVAGAYQRRGWRKVEFIPRQPGKRKTPDLQVSSGRRHWSVECKRVNRSGYEAAEREHGELLAAQVHDLCRETKASLVLRVTFLVELASVEESYLAQKVQQYLDDHRQNSWVDDQSWGSIQSVNWRLANAVLSHDDVFYGSSRMIELFSGGYASDADHSVLADWKSSRARPLHAKSVSRATVVSWKSESREAAVSKARHFRSIVAGASKQLLSDRPGVVHVGYEAREGNSVDALRHQLNSLEMRSFDPGQTRLRWVYGNYLMPEHVNKRNESHALSETTAIYKIGRHGTEQPLPHHLLFSNGSGRPGVHWE